MANCVACGSKAKEKRIELDYCRICGINFDNRIQMITDSQEIKDLENTYSKVINTIETKDNYNDENKERVINHVKNIYNNQKMKIESDKNDKLSKGLIYEIKGNRGKTLEVYKNKVVITTEVTVGSIVAGNTTDGKKTIYFKDIIGLQFKRSKTLIGFLQFETASSTMNNEKSNFWNENTFTFDESTTSNEKMEEIENYIDKELERIKTLNNSLSIADEIRKFKSLLDDQIITNEEFEKKKEELLNL